jgi:hypothetical protein
LTRRFVEVNDSNSGFRPAVTRDLFHMMKA